MYRRLLALASAGPHTKNLRKLIRSAQVRACDDRASCWNIGIPHKRACALLSYALTYVALNQEPPSLTFWGVPYELRDVHPSAGRLHLISTQAKKMSALRICFNCVVDAGGGPPRLA